MDEQEMLMPKEPMTTRSPLYPLGEGDPPAPCKRPTEGAWTRVAKKGHAEAYDHRLADIRVLSSVDFIPETEGGNGWEYHVSVTKLRKGQPTLASDEHVRVALRAFGMLKAGEDNHTKGGVARNFWLPVDGRPPHCDCFDQEPVPMGDGSTSAVWREDAKDKRVGPLEVSDERRTVTTMTPCPECNGRGWLIGVDGVMPPCRACLSDGSVVSVKTCTCPPDTSAFGWEGHLEGCPLYSPRR